MPTRPALLIRIEDNAGCFGWGEVWANFPARANIHKAHMDRLDGKVALITGGARGMGAAECTNGPDNARAAKCGQCSCKFLQPAKVYPTRMNGYENDEAAKFFRHV